MATLFLTLLKDSPKHEAKQKSFLHTLPGARATCGMHAHAPPPARPVHVPRLACPAPCPAQVPHVVSMDSARPAPMPGARATCGTHTARSAFCPAHVPHVARTPHAPPLAWRTCHTWHVRRTLRPCPAQLPHVACTPPVPPLPGACATRGTMFNTWPLTAGAALLPGSCATRGITPHAPPLAQLTLTRACLALAVYHAWSQKYRHSMRHVWSKCHMWHDLRAPGVADLPPPTR